MAGHIIAKPTVEVNNTPYGVIAGSVKFTEGMGEYKRVIVVTGDNVEALFSEDAETQYPKVSFTLAPNIEAIDDARTWKNNKNLNLVRLSFEDVSTGKVFGRTFSGASIDNDYEVTLSPDGTIELEWSASSTS